MSRVKIREIRLRNYRAFANARLVLDDVTFLVGRNGAGKSTLMDAMAFVSEALTDSLANAMERRGNLSGIQHRRSNRSNQDDVSIAIQIDIGEFDAAIYGFSIGKGTTRGAVVVKKEILEGFKFDSSDKFVNAPTEYYLAQMPEFLLTPRNRNLGYSHNSNSRNESLTLMLGMQKDPIQSEILDALKKITFHQFSPEVMQAEPGIGSESRLNRIGSNVGDVLKHAKPEDRAWIVRRLAGAVPGIVDVSASSRAGRRMILFEQEGSGRKNVFEAAKMSEGTVRSLGILLALAQSQKPSTVVIDGIEDFLHPFTQSVMLDAIEEVSVDMPVVVSTHNPEILSHPSARGERIRVIQWDQGVSQIYHLRQDVKDFLQPPETVGRLLRSNALFTEDQPSVCGPGDDFFAI